MSETIKHGSIYVRSLVQSEMKFVEYSSVIPVLLLYDRKLQIASEGGLRAMIFSTTNRFIVD